MKLFVAIVLVVLAGVCAGQGQISQGETAGLAFMNITPDTREVGFIQIFAVTPNISTIHLESLTGLNEFDVITTSLSQFYNATYDYNELKVVNATSAGKSYSSSLGLLLSSSTDDVHVYGVKSDRGTVDGFLALPLTLESTEFFIASWQCVSAQFYAAFQVIAALADTCVEVYRIVNGTKYVRTQSIYLEDPFDVYLYVAQVGEDLTGLYVNSTKPVSILAGHSCAFIPNKVYFCDHIVEQIAPITELGRQHFVPPILGRNSDAGYIVRVVATSPDTAVSWSSSSGVVSGNSIITRGQFQEITNSQASESMMITCSTACLVMQYNTGRQNAPTGIIDKPTDPFMMNIAPVDRFDSKAAFATASFCQVVQSVTYKIDFNNYVAIVTATANIKSILLDGQPVASVTSWRSMSSWGYSVAVLAVSHGAHVVTASGSTPALFGVYAYGHSTIDSSSGAYGFTVAFKMSGTLLSELWQKSQQDLSVQMEQGQATTCEQERIRSGSAVAQYPSPRSPAFVSYPFTLDVTIQSPAMSATCRDLYRAALTADLLDLSRQVNYRLCTLGMCADLSGPAGSGVPINTSLAGIGWSRQQVEYAAINTLQMTNPVSFDVDDTTGAITAIHVVVPYIGILDTTSESFAGCRVEVREFMRPFVNWPNGIQLIADIGGCPHITFNDPFEFILRQQQNCPIM